MLRYLIYSQGRLNRPHIAAAHAISQVWAYFPIKPKNILIFLRKLGHLLPVRIPRALIDKVNAGAAHLVMAVLLISLADFAIDLVLGVVPKCPLP